MYVMYRTGKERSHQITRMIYEKRLSGMPTQNHRAVAAEWRVEK